MAERVPTCGPLAGVGGWAAGGSIDHGFGRRRRVPRMDLKKIRVVGGPLVRATAADVADAESQLWITFPPGYREYVTTLGEGVLGGSFVRVYPPWRIRELAEWRDRIRKYWFWDKGRKVLPKERRSNRSSWATPSAATNWSFTPAGPTGCRVAAGGREGLRGGERPPGRRRVDV